MRLHMSRQRRRDEHIRLQNRRGGISLAAVASTRYYADLFN